MDISIHNNNKILAKIVAYEAACIIEDAIKNHGNANIILATGMTQVEILENLVKQNIDWSKLTVFHLDEYIGLPNMHSGSFQKYIYERFESKVKNLKKIHYVYADSSVIDSHISELNKIIADTRIDLVFLGVGDNGHIAFNEPPADFNAKTPYLKIKLTEISRKQQFNQGWFKSMEDTPSEAITMSIPQIIKSKNIITIVNSEHKADIVQRMISEPVNPNLPATILQSVPSVHLHLTAAAAKNVFKML